MNKFVLFIVCLFGGLSLHSQTPVTGLPSQWGSIDHFDALQYSVGNHFYIGGRSSEGPLTWNAYPGNVQNEYRFRYSNVDAAQMVYVPQNGHWAFRVSDNSVSYGGLVTWKNIMTISRFDQVDIDGSLSVNDHGIAVNNGGVSQFDVDVNGNVNSGNITVNNGYFQIKNGTANQFKVDVNGNVRCREVQVDMDPIPDYVFEADYNLMPLSDLQQYINTEKHLPNIPSAAEYKERGKVALGEMSRLLLEKVEELTLYTLQQQKQIEQLQTQLNNLKEEKATTNQK